MVSAKDAFFNKLFEQIVLGEDIVVVSADLGAPSLDELRAKFPERFINVGIAEQSLISVSAGLSMTGKKVVAYGLNPFPVTRAFDQIRSLMAEFAIPVTLCGLNAGFCSAEAGLTHMPIENIGMMRMLANIRMTNPSDETIAGLLAEETAACNVPRYIQFDKTISGVIYQKEDINFKDGFTVYGSGSIAVVSYGCYIGALRDIADRYALKGYGIKVLDLHTLPLNEEKLCGELAGTSHIITLEENALPCGVGSLVLEVLSDHGINIPVTRMGFQISGGYFDEFTSREYIRHRRQLDEASIICAIDGALARGIKQ